jgi:hypothetical protein
MYSGHWNVFAGVARLSRIERLSRITSKLSHRRFAASIHFPHLLNVLLDACIQFPQMSWSNRIPGDGAQKYDSIPGAPIGYPKMLHRQQ